jgi:hypothetical protein
MVALPPLAPLEDEEERGQGGHDAMARETQRRRGREACCISGGCGETPRGQALGVGASGGEESR